MISFCGSQVGSEAGRSDQGFALLGVLQRLGRRGVPHHQELVRVHHIGDPVELAQIGLEPRRETERLVGGEALADDADHGPVARRDLRHVVGGRDAAAARHVDRDERRIAGNVLAHEAGEEARIFIVVAARRGAHDETDLLALIEVAHRVRHGGRGTGGQNAAHHNAEKPGHCFLSMHCGPSGAS
jgi:hypothetical protein